ncbi:hypothetical protein [Geminisphaera colitermitum]|uniref:hypothetical protein n=1 Tax=Geminisphaera colitermitum TaxID=1148786 RepID=UPI0018E326FE|nr:hypothetical protein [Geminisphaera colitermitum]
MWSNAPRIPSQGMEALIALPYTFVSLVMAPFIVGLGILLWQRPRRAALKLAYVIPTIILTVGGVFGFYVTPRASTATYEIPLSFVDEQGKPVSDLAVKVVHSSPRFDIIRGGKTRREEAFQVATSEFNLTKTKGEETEIRIEKNGYYLTKVTIPHVWPAKRDYGLQRIHIEWQKDWSGGRWGVDACQAAMNWPLKSKEHFNVIMLDFSAPAISPLSEYTEEDSRALQNANK